MGERACPIGLLSLPLLAACGTGTDFVSDADAAANASGAMVPTSEHGADSESTSVESPCFRNDSGGEAWACDADGVTLTRKSGAGASETIRCPHGCVPLPDGFDSQCRPRDGDLAVTVNGHAMSAQQASW
jgi:hypothetical protein